MAIKILRNKKSPCKNYADILSTQEFDGGFMDYFISTQPWPLWILFDHIRFVYKVVPFNLNSYWFSYFIYLLISVEGILIFLLSHIFSRTPAWVQTRLLWAYLLLSSSADEVPSWWHSHSPLAGIHSIPLSELLSKVYFFFFNVGLGKIHRAFRKHSIECLAFSEGKTKQNNKLISLLCLPFQLPLSWENINFSKRKPLFRKGEIKWLTWFLSAVDL